MLTALRDSHNRDRPGAERQVFRTRGTVHRYARQEPWLRSRNLGIGIFVRVTSPLHLFSLFRSGGRGSAPTHDPGGGYGGALRPPVCRDRFVRFRVFADFLHGQITTISTALPKKSAASHTTAIMAIISKVCIIKSPRTQYFLHNPGNLWHPSMQCTVHPGHPRDARLR